MSACGISCTSCSGRNLAGARRSSTRIDQLNLAFEDIEQTIAATEADDDKKDPAGARERAEKRRANRGALPSHLPRVHVTIEPDDTHCPCCRAPMHVIGEETAERLDVIPAQFRVIVTHRRGDRQGAGDRLVSGTYGVGTACARQPLDPL